MEIMDKGGASVSDLIDSDESLIPIEVSKKSFRQELEFLINRHSMENASDTPDFILSRYLMACLIAYNDAVGCREDWYGRPCGNGATILGPANTDGTRTLDDPKGPILDEKHT
jgi:hypothetical protein